MTDLTAPPRLLLDVLLIVVTMSALAWRESRLSRRVYAWQRERTTRIAGYHRSTPRVGTLRARRRGGTGTPEYPGGPTGLSEGVAHDLGDRRVIVHDEDAMRMGRARSA